MTIENMLGDSSNDPRGDLLAIIALQDTIIATQSAIIAALETLAKVRKEMESLK